MGAEHARRGRALRLARGSTIRGSNGRRRPAGSVRERGSTHVLHMAAVAACAARCDANAELQRRREAKGSDCGVLGASFRCTARAPPVGDTPSNNRNRALQIAG